MTSTIPQRNKFEMISIHMPHTWHDAEYVGTLVIWYISIHMPHTWHDGIYYNKALIAIISIHMPHTWHDRSTQGRTRTH